MQLFRKEFHKCERPPCGGRCIQNRVLRAYDLSEVDTVLKVVLRLVPTAATATTIATAISAAIRPYSIAVAPDSSRTKRERKLFMEASALFDTLCVHEIAYSKETALDGPGESYAPFFNHCLNLATRDMCNCAATAQQWGVLARNPGS